jgi:hydrogenase/urease accessory protein HupE
MELSYRCDGGASTPFGFLVAAGSLTVVGATIAAALALPAPATVPRVAAVALAVGAFAAGTPNLGASLLTGVLGFLFATGFLVNRFGELTWHGQRSAVHLSLVLGAVAVGRVVRRSGPAAAWSVPARWCRQLRPPRARRVSADDRAGGR